MQSLKDAAVVLGLLLLLVSVKVTPMPDVGDVIPSAEAASADTGGGLELAGFSSDALVPAVRLDQASDVEASDTDSNFEMMHVRVDAEAHRCDSSIVHVQTLGLEGSGERIILRIDTSDGQAQVERVETVQPAPRTDHLEACKIG
jgi:hypothetical protein